MIKKDSFDNYKSTSAPSDLAAKVLKQNQETINPNSYLLSFKYLGLFITSIFLSLYICPQRGFVVFRNSFPFFHNILHYSEVLCGLYCGAVFFSTTHVLTFFLLSRFERIKIIRKISYLPLMVLSAFFGLTMFSSSADTGLGFTYSITWITVVLFLYFIFNNLYSNKNQISK